MVYTLILYLRLIAQCGEGNATLDKRFNFVNIISIDFKIFDSFLFPKNACNRKVGSLHDLSLNQYEKDNQRLSGPHSSPVIIWPSHIIQIIGERGGMWRT